MVLSLTLRNEPAEFARMTAWIEDAVAEFALTEQTAYALRLCLEEAVANIVHHAFEPGSSHQVHVSLWRDATALHAEVTDDGRAFNPLAKEPSPVPRDLQSAPVGGRGIRLMREFASHVSYQRIGVENRLTFTFAVHPSTPAEKEIGGPKGPEPTRYGDWEVKGRATDF